MMDAEQLITKLAKHLRWYVDRSRQQTARRESLRVLAEAEAYAKAQGVERRTYWVVQQWVSSGGLGWWTTCSPEMTEAQAAEQRDERIALGIKSQTVRVDETRTFIAGAAPEQAHAADCGGWTRELGGWFMTGEEGRAETAAEWARQLPDLLERLGDDVRYRATTEIVAWLRRDKGDSQLVRTAELGIAAEIETGRHIAKADGGS